jgi:hypothetical protein
MDGVAPATEGRRQRAAAPPASSRRAPPREAGNPHEPAQPGHGAPATPARRRPAATLRLSRRHGVRKAPETNGHMSKSPLRAPWVNEALEKDRGTCSGAGNPFGNPGDLIPPDETRVPAPARRSGHIRDTPCRIRATRCDRGESGRVLSRPQEPPLSHARCRRALGKSGACGELGSRTANRMAVPQSPSIRERACPAWPGTARITHGHRQEGGEDWTFSAGSTGPKTTTTSPS